MSVWYIFPFISIGVLALAGLIWIFGSMKYKRERKLTPYQCLCIGLFLAALLLAVPIHYSLNKLYDATKSAELARGFYAIFGSAQQAFRMFIMDGSVSDILSMLTELETEYQLVIPEHAMRIYEMYGGFIYIAAPLLTFGFILSFFKNAVALMRYYFRLNVKEVHIFSELNEKSLALAKSIYYDKPKKLCEKIAALFTKKLIVFTDVLKKNEETSIDRIESAREIRAILFKNDIASIKLTRYTHHIYLIGDDESEKVNQATKIINNYSKKENKHLWIFSDSEESKCLLNSYSKIEKGKIRMKVARIDDIRFLIYHHLYESGINLYENSYSLAEDQKYSSNHREISVIIVGLGKYGTEMLKALLWYCQFPGYRIKITAIDEDIHATSRFKAMCPGIELGEWFDADGDMRYCIDILVDNIGRKSYRDKIESVLEQNQNRLSYAFFALGSDDANIAASIEMRRILEAKKCSTTIIETVVYDSALKERISPSVAVSDNIPKISKVIDESVKYGDALDEPKDIKNKSKESISEKRPVKKSQKRNKDDELAEILKSLKYTDVSMMSNFRIGVIGDIYSFYSIDTVINSAMINNGLNVHKRWLNKTISKTVSNNANQTEAVQYDVEQTPLEAPPMSAASKIESKYNEIDKKTKAEKRAKKLSKKDDLKNRVSELEYYMEDYNFYSSISKAIHYKLRSQILNRLLYYRISKDKKLENPFPTLSGNLNESEVKKAFFNNEKNNAKVNGYQWILKHTVTAEDANKIYYAVDERISKDTQGKIFSSLGIHLDECFNDLYYLDMSKIFAQNDENVLVKLVAAASAIEHIRWNAYMKTEGFVYSEDKDKYYKLHNLIISTESLKIEDMLNDI